MLTDELHQSEINQRALQLIGIRMAHADPYLRTSSPPGVRLVQRLSA